MVDLAPDITLRLVTSLRGSCSGLGLRNDSHLVRGVSDRHPDAHEGLARRDRDLAASKKFQPLEGPLEA